MKNTQHIVAESDHHYIISSTAFLALHDADVASEAEEAFVRYASHVYPADRHSVWKQC